MLVLILIWIVLLSEEDVITVENILVQLLEQLLDNVQFLMILLVELQLIVFNLLGDHGPNVQ